MQLSRIFTLDLTIEGPSLRGIFMMRNALRQFGAGFRFHAMDECRELNRIYKKG